MAGNTERAQVEPRDAGGLRVDVGGWDQLGGLATSVRMEVFVREQGIPAEHELDPADAQCLHAVIRSTDGGGIATGRLLPDDRIGRMAVLPQWRGRGLGAQVLEVLVRAARARGSRRVYLHAQASAVGFYERAGFQPEGERFLEEGIEHLTMSLSLVD